MTSTKKFLFIAGSVLVIGILLASHFNSHPKRRTPTKVSKNLGKKPIQDGDEMPESELIQKQKFIRDTARKMWRHLGMDREDELGPTSVAISGLSTLFIMRLGHEFNQTKSQLPEHINQILSAPEELTYQSIEQLLSGLLSAYALSGDQDFLDQGEKIAQLIGPDSVLGLPNIDTMGFNESAPTDRQPSPAWAGDLLLAYHNLRQMTGNTIQYEKVICHLQKFFAQLTSPDLLYGNHKEESFQFDSESWRQFYLLNSRLQKNGIATSNPDSSQVLEIQLSILANEFSTQVDLFRKPSILSEINSLPDEDSGRAEAHRSCIIGVALRLDPFHQEHSGTWSQLTLQCFMAAWEGLEQMTPTVRAKVLLLNWRTEHTGPITDSAWKQVKGIRDSLDSRSKIRPKDFNHLAATLKYLYLIFNDDSVLAIDKWIFNSAGQPLPIFPEPEDLKYISKCTINFKY